MLVFLAIIFLYTYGEVPKRLRGQFAKLLDGDESCVGSNPTLAAKPECALGLVECGVKSIDKIEVICLSFRC